MKSASFSLKKSAGFTVTEVCVLVAMASLTLTVTVPRLMTAQGASAVAQAKADLNVISTGLEMYKADVGAYPWQNGDCTIMKGAPNRGWTLERLTTPVSYITGTAPYYDPFVATHYYTGLHPGTETPMPGNNDILSKCYWYNARNLRDSSTWGQTQPHDRDPVWYFLESAGPDLHRNMTAYNLNTMATDTDANRAICGPYIYDSTNGTSSRGSIWKLGGQPEGYGTSMAFMINSADETRVQDWANYR